MAMSMPSPGGMGNNNMRKDNRDRNDRGSMPRGGSMSGSGYNNNNKLNRGGNYQDNDGWIQTGGNKGRGGNNNIAFDSSKFRGQSVSYHEREQSIFHNCLFPFRFLIVCIVNFNEIQTTEYRRYYKNFIGHTQSIQMEA